MDKYDMIDKILNKAEQQYCRENKGGWLDKDVYGDLLENATQEELNKFTISNDLIADLKKLAEDNDEYYG